MSDQAGGTGTGTASQPQGPSEKLYDAQGQGIRSGTHQIQATTEQLTSLIREQPITAAVIALGIGYILGKVV
jgi:hypothetical protein